MLVFAVNFIVNNDQKIYHALYMLCIIYITDIIITETFLKLRNYFLNYEDMNTEYFQIATTRYLSVNSCQIKLGIKNKRFETWAK